MRALAPNSHTALEKMVCEARVKDSVAQPIIECLVTLGNEVWKRQGTMSSEGIQEVLNAELRRLKALGPIQNPLLEMNGVLQ